jgi:hypothetical protein
MAWFDMKNSLEDFWITLEGVAMAARWRVDQKKEYVRRERTSLHRVPEAGTPDTGQSQGAGGGTVHNAGKCFDVAVACAGIAAESVKARRLFSFLTRCKVLHTCRPLHCSNNCDT